MKYLLITVYTLFSLSSCQKSNQEKAENLVKQMMSQNMPNFGSYEPIEFGKLQNAELYYEETYPYYLLMKKIKENTEAMKEKASYIDKWKSIERGVKGISLDKERNEITELYKLVQLYNDSIEHEKKRFKPDTTRFMMSHKFRYYDESLKKHIIESPIIYFDKDITKVVGMQGRVDKNNNLVYIEIELPQSLP